LARSKAPRCPRHYRLRERARFICQAELAGFLLQALLTPKPKLPIPLKRPPIAESGPEAFGGTADGGSSGGITVAPVIHIHAAALTEHESVRVARQIKDHVAFELASDMEKVAATISRRP
jgi:hypothetical protein